MFSLSPCVDGSIAAEGHAETGPTGHMTNLQALQLVHHLWDLAVVRSASAETAVVAVAPAVDGAGVGAGQEEGIKIAFRS